MQKTIIQQKRHYNAFQKGCRKIYFFFRRNKRIINIGTILITLFLYATLEMITRMVIGQENIINNSSIPTKIIYGSIDAILKYCGF